MDDAKHESNDHGLREAGKAAWDDTERLLRDLDALLKAHAFDHRKRLSAHIAMFIRSREADLRAEVERQERITLQWMNSWQSGQVAYRELHDEHQRLKAEAVDLASRVRAETLNKAAEQLSRVADAFAALVQRFDPSDAHLYHMVEQNKALVSSWRARSTDSAATEQPQREALGFATPQTAALAQARTHQEREDRPQCDACNEPWPCYAWLLEVKVNSLADERDALQATRDECERQYQAMVAEVIAEMNRVAELQRKVDAVAALHQPKRVRTGTKTHGGPDEYGKVCRVCKSSAGYSERWPCPTVRAALAETGERDG